jgi:hypothetical protein
MAYKLVGREFCVYENDFRCEYVCDTADDAANLPKSCVGSTAMVAAKGGPVYMVNASGEWEEL